MNYKSPYTILTKYNNDGGIIWQKVLGSPNGLFEIVALSPCKDGSFYAVGFGRAIEDFSIRHDPDVIASTIIQLVCDELEFNDMENDSQFMSLNNILREIHTLKIPL